MKRYDISNIGSVDRQLVQIGIELKSKILSSEKVDDDCFARIVKIAQEWDRVFQDSLSPRKGEAS